MNITNRQRADWAAKGLHAYAVGKEGVALYDEAELVLSDLLTDLMHYAEREGLAFERCIERAHSHYEEERGEEQYPTAAEQPEVAS